MSRGHLRVYLGYAAGVGKTFAMLDEGNRRRERGTDVVVGYVETHGRSRTAERIRGLELVARRRLQHRGQAFEELDVDALLVRRPQVALIDELAHANVPGSRNPKRWQDVEEVLRAGITVITTLNIQHLESLNDVVERITGVKQRETLPDTIVRAADQIEMVDMSPWALRRRMAHGNVYPPEKIDAALGNYFREGNLTALRELALLWVADRVDEALKGYMEEHRILGPWEARERIVVAVSGRPRDEQLVRRAARMAVRRGGDLLAVHVQAEDGLASGVGGEVALRHELVRDLGGRFYEVVGSDVPRALLEFARAENATQIVLGASTRSRWAELTRGSVVNRVVRDSGPIDVHIISLAGESGERSELLASFPSSSLPFRRKLFGLALAVAGLPLMTAVLTRVRESVGLPSVLLLYLIAVVTVAAVGGWIPAALAAVAGSLIVNWYFTPPLHTWTISEPHNLLAIVVFLLVAGLVSALVGLATRRRSEAERGRLEAEILARLAGSLMRDDDPLPDLVDRLQTTFELESVSVFRREGDGWHLEASSGPPLASPDQATDTLALADDAILALAGRRLPAEDRRILSAFVAQVSVAVRARRLTREAATAAELGEINRLRTAILAAVSHDLRTPLASVKAAVTSLRQGDILWTVAQTREFLATIEEETDRLNGLVGNLLDMSRLQAGALSLQCRPVGMDEVVPRALAGLPHPGERIEIDVPETLPRVTADPALLERAIANAVANAMAWSPPEHPVRILASEAGGRIDLRIVDRGPGIPTEESARVFEPFQRLGDRSTGTGVGLGLAVAKGFVEAMGGSITLEETPGGGLTLVLSLKAAA